MAIEEKLADKLVRIDENLHWLMDIEAAKDRLTLKAWVEQLIRAELGRRGINTES